MKITREKVMSVAQSVGIDQLPEDIASSVAPDVDYRLREILQEAIKFMKHGKRDKLLVGDINDALRLRNVEILYGYSSSTAPRRYVVSNQAPGVYFADDQVADFNTLLGVEMPPVPRDTTFTLHWLAINGVQPAIPQNPSMVALSKSRKKRSAVDVRPVRQHVLSKELQIYREAVMEAVRGDDEKRREVALESVQNDPGLNDLLPYFSQFICEEITRNLSKLAHLRKILSLSRVILLSEHFHVEPYLAQLIPAILTCLVGKQLCQNRRDDHWSLRDEAAEQIKLLCDSYAVSFPSLQPRITKTLLNAFLDQQKPLTTHYGAFRGLAALGIPVVQLVILPNLEYYMGFLKSKMSASDSKLEAQKVRALLVEIANSYVKEAAETHAQLFQESLPDSKKGKRKGNSRSKPATKRSKRSKGKEDDEEGEDEPAAEEEEDGAPQDDQDAYDKVLRTLLPDFGSFVSMLQDLFGDEIDVEGVDL